jgi:bifunctional ADP-heptose synthase (sugar kinase/adenylyltransferase)
MTIDEIRQDKDNTAMSVARMSAEMTVITAEKTTVSTKLGAASAAFVASGIGCLVIGLLTTLAEVSEGLKTALNWWNPAGPLSGKTGLGVIAWAVSWLVLHRLWKDQESDFGRAFTLTLILLAVGFLLTFPPVFELFAG